MLNDLKQLQTPQEAPAIVQAGCDEATKVIGTAIPILTGLRADAPRIGPCIKGVRALNDRVAALKRSAEGVVDQGGLDYLVNSLQEIAEPEGKPQNLFNLFKTNHEGRYTRDANARQRILGQLALIEGALIDRATPYATRFGIYLTLDVAEVEAHASHEPLKTFCKEAKTKFKDDPVAVFISHHPAHTELAKMMAKHLRRAGIVVNTSDEATEVVGGSATATIQAVGAANKVVVLGTLEYRRSEGDLNSPLHYEIQAVQDAFCFDHTSVVSLVVQGSVELSLPTLLSTRMIVSADCTIPERYVGHVSGIVKRLHDLWLEDHPRTTRWVTKTVQAPQQAEKRDPQKQTLLLHKAVRKGDTEAVRRLVTAGHQPREIGPVGDAKLTPLQTAVHYGKVDCVQALMEIDPTLAKQPLQAGGSLVHLAINAGQIDTLIFMLAEYAEQMNPLLKGEDSLGRTPLALAAHKGQIDVACLLMGHWQASALAATGSYVNYANSSGRTCMHWAASGGSPNMMSLLVGYGGNLTLRGKSNKAPLDLAQGDALKETIAELEMIAQNPASLQPNFRERPPHNLVFKGGGPKFHVVIGALECLEDEGLLQKVKRVAGTGAGSMLATLFAIGIPVDEIAQIAAQKGSFANLLTHPLARLKDRDDLAKIPASLLHLKDFSPANDGLDPGETLHAFVEKIVAERTKIADCTFADLKDKKGIDLYIIARKYDGSREITIMSWEHPAFKNALIAWAVVASSGLPVTLEARKPRTKDAQKVVRKRDDLGTWCDGSAIFNLGLETFDYHKYRHGKAPKAIPEMSTPNPRTLALSIESTKPSKEEKPQASIFAMPGHQFRVWRHAEGHTGDLVPYSRQRVIAFDDCVASKNKTNLRAAGYAAAESFLS